MSEELIIKEIEDNKDKYIEFLRDIIKTDTYNPPGNEKNVALKIEKYLIEAGIKCEIFPFGENRANLIAYLNKNFDGKNLLYNGHMDVVPPGDEKEWKYPPLSAFVKRNKIMYGRGTADMKGGLAAMVITLEILKKLDLSITGNLILNAVSDEEKGGYYGAIPCIENNLNHIKCDFVIVGEPTKAKPMPLAIIVGEKGHLQLKLITTGRSCHASVPFVGNNAIIMMNNIIYNLEKLQDLIPTVNPPLSSERIKELFSNSFPNKQIFERIFNEQPLLQNYVKSITQYTQSVTMIKGGIKENVVPDECEAVINFRLLPGQTSEVIINALKDLIKSLGYGVYENDNSEVKDNYVKIEIIQDSDGSYWNNWEQSEDLKKLSLIIERVYKRKPYYSVSPAGADSRYFRNTQYCPQTILLGPGNVSTAHSVDESIDLDDFINIIKVYTLFAYEFIN